MDTEFPRHRAGVHRPVGSFKSNAELHYQTLKANVDLLKLIQLGLTFSDERGDQPNCGTGKRCVWQVKLPGFRRRGRRLRLRLRRAAAPERGRLPEEQRDGRRLQSVRELLMTSGTVLNDAVHWITFHN